MNPLNDPSVRFDLQDISTAIAAAGNRRTLHFHNLTLMPFGSANDLYVRVEVSSGDSELDELRRRAAVLNAIIQCLEDDAELRSMVVQALSPISRTQSEAPTHSLRHHINVAFAIISLLGNMVTLIVFLEGLWPIVLTWIQSILR